MSAEFDTFAAGSRRLTPKERECLRLVLENRSSKDIGRRLGISHTSVDTHIRRARAKLGLRDRYEAARLVAQWDRHGAAVGGRPQRAGARAEPGLSALSGVAHAWIPPIETLGVLGRLGLIVATAAFIALVFGIVLNAMRAL